MFPKMWSSPPCKNIEVKMVRIEAYAGTNPYLEIMFSKSVKLQMKTKTFKTISEIVRIGVLLLGALSERGKN